MVPWWAIQQRQSRIRRSRTGTGRGSQGGRRPSHGRRSHGVRSDGSAVLTCGLSTWQQEPHTDMSWFADLFFFLIICSFLQFAIITLQELWPRRPFKAAKQQQQSKVLHSGDRKLNSLYWLHFKWAIQQRQPALFFLIYLSHWVSHPVIHQQRTRTPATARTNERFFNSPAS